MLVYPRLPRPTAETLIDELGTATLRDLRDRSSSGHPGVTFAATGGSRADEAEIRGLQGELRAIAERLGWPQDPGTSERLEFDRRAATALVDGMEIVPADAAEPGVWAFLCCVAVPDLACWRFPGRTRERLLGGPRNALRRLWWRAYVLDRGSREGLSGRLGEDETVQIMERPTLAGNPGSRRRSRTHTSDALRAPGPTGGCISCATPRSVSSACPRS